LTATANLDVIPFPTNGVHAGIKGSASRPRSASLGLALLLVATGVWLAFPVRIQLSRSELRRLEGQWSQVQALDDGRAEMMNNQLRPVAGPEDTARLGRAFAALDREEVAALSTIRHRLASDFVVDGRLRHLRAVMQHTIALEVGDLDRAARFYATSPDASVTPPKERSDLTMSALAELQRLIVNEHLRFALRPTRVRPARQLRSADSTLVAFGHILDEPTATTLAAVTAQGPVIIDIDANKVTPVKLEGLPQSSTLTGVLARHAYLVLRAVPRDLPGQFQYYAVDPGFNGPAMPLGAAGNAVPAPDPDHVWLDRYDGTAVKLDGRGHILEGPVRLPAGSSVRAALAAGLVLSTPSGASGQALDVWDPEHGRTVRRLASHANEFVAGSHDTVVWFESHGPQDRTVHLTSVSTGQDRMVASGTIQPSDFGWAFSPDGTRLASTWRHSPPGGRQDLADWVLGFVDVASGQVQLLPANHDQQGAGPAGLTWAAAADRVFLPGTIETNGPFVATYREGDVGIQHLRLKGIAVLDVAVIPD
jgi:hypothetical protein